MNIHSAPMNVIIMRFKHLFTQGGLCVYERTVLMNTVLKQCTYNMLGSSATGDRTASSLSSASGVDVIRSATPENNPPSLEKRAACVIFPPSHTNN